MPNVPKTPAWRQGMTVAVIYSGSRVSKRFVARVGKQYVDVSDGSRYDLCGVRSPRCVGEAPRIEIWNATHTAKLFCQQLRADLLEQLANLQFELDTADLERLEAIRAALHPLM